ncbi:hypothetical protein SDC9_145506 [bioreactor metagenome]|uniref:Uncharacterized protein n=1 Tax=bioreactor metagenome TaxID=1076179 RepID=A0A645EA83_9ZZZZ
MFEPLSHGGVISISLVHLLPDSIVHKIRITYLPAKEIVHKFGHHASARISGTLHPFDPFFIEISGPQVLAKVLLHSYHLSPVYVTCIRNIHIRGVAAKIPRCKIHATEVLEKVIVVKRVVQV